MNVDFKFLALLSLDDIVFNFPAVPGKIDWQADKVPKQRKIMHNFTIVPVRNIDLVFVFDISNEFCTIIAGFQNLNYVFCLPNYMEVIQKDLHFIELWRSHFFE